MVALIITTYNRPEYLKRCLESLSAVIYPKDTTLYIIDDASYDLDTIEMLNKYSAKCKIILMQNDVNSGIKKTLSKGINSAICDGNNTIITLDSDTIVKPNFIDVLLSLKSKHPEHIVSGFNTLTKNERNIIRHPVLKQFDSHCTKQSIGGINLCFNMRDYLNVIYPALMSNSYHWDWGLKHDLPYIVSTPSVVQHIGFESSLGNSHNPDVAFDF